PSYPLDLPSFPTRRSSDLHLHDDCVGGPSAVRPLKRASRGRKVRRARRPGQKRTSLGVDRAVDAIVVATASDVGGEDDLRAEWIDRKSTRLNSSHVSISYA